MTEHDPWSPTKPPGPAPDPDAPLPSRPRAALVGVILAVAAGSIAYRLLVRGRLEQTSALFIGLPTLLAVMLALTPRAKSATGLIVKGTTIALLMSGPLLGEGFICIVMAAPLFYLVGVIVGLVVDRARARRNRMLAVVALPLLAMSLEGTAPSLTLPTRESVTVTRLVPAAPAAVERALAQQPRFDRPLPAFLRMRFPVPVRARGEGLAPGDVRVVSFAGGEGKPGDLTLRVTSRAPGAVSFAAESDTSKIAHWLSWRAAHVAWTEEAGATRVTWTLEYDRELDPKWYFGPIERLAVRDAAGYLLDCLATPSPGVKATPSPDMSSTPSPGENTPPSPGESTPPSPGENTPPSPP